MCVERAVEIIIYVLSSIDRMFSVKELSVACCKSIDGTIDRARNIERSMHMARRGQRNGQLIC